MKVAVSVENSSGSGTRLVYEQVVRVVKSFVVSFVNERRCRRGVVHTHQQRASNHAIESTQLRT